MKNLIRKIRELPMGIRHALRVLRKQKKCKHRYEKVGEGTHGDSHEFYKRYILRCAKCNKLIETEEWINQKGETYYGY